MCKFSLAYCELFKKFIYHFTHVLVETEDSVQQKIRIQNKITFKFKVSLWNSGALNTMKS